MTSERVEDEYSHVDTGQTEHEKRVEQHLQERTGSPTDAADPSVDEGRRPTSTEDLAADRSGDADVTPD